MHKLGKMNAETKTETNINSETKTERFVTCVPWCKIVFYSLEIKSVGIHPFSFMCDVCACTCLHLMHDYTSCDTNHTDCIM